MNEMIVMKGISNVQLQKYYLADLKVRDINERIERDKWGFYRIRNGILYKGSKDTEGITA